MPRPDEERPASPAAQDCSDAPLPLSAVRAHDAAPQHDSALRAAGAGAPAPDPTPPALIRKYGRSVAAPLPPGSSTTFSKDSGSRTQDSASRKQNISASEGRRPTENRRCSLSPYREAPAPRPAANRCATHSTIAPPRHGTSLSTGGKSFSHHALPAGYCPYRLVVTSHTFPAMSSAPQAAAPAGQQPTGAGASNPFALEIARSGVGSSDPHGYVAALPCRIIRGGDFPFGFGRQAQRIPLRQCSAQVRVQPAAKRCGFVVPGHADHRLIRAGVTAVRPIAHGRVRFHFCFHVRPCSVQYSSLAYPSASIKARYCATVTG
jgi:hypothetical protein